MYARVTCRRALPFGLSTAPFAFTKLMRQLVNKWTREGRRVMQYIDDELFAVSGSLSQEEAMAQAQEVLADLRAAGSKVNLEKSFGHCPEQPPVRRCVALGMVIDTAKGVFEVAEKRKEKIAAQAASLLESVGPVLVRDVASLAGRVASCSLAIDSATRIYTRALYAVIETRTSWNGRVLLSPEARGEVEFWASFLQAHPGSEIWPRGPLRPFVAASDASDSHRAAWLDDQDEENSAWANREQFSPGA